MPYLVSSRERSYRPNLGYGWGVLKLRKSPESEKKNLNSGCGGVSLISDELDQTKTRAAGRDSYDTLQSWQPKIP